MWLAWKISEFSKSSLISPRQLSFDQTVKISLCGMIRCMMCMASIRGFTYLHFEFFCLFSHLSYVRMLWHSILAKVSFGASGIASVLVMSLKALLVNEPVIPSTRCYIIYIGHWVPFYSVFLLVFVTKAVNAMWLSTDVIYRVECFFHHTALSKPPLFLPMLAKSPMELWSSFCLLTVTLITSRYMTCTRGLASYI